MKNSFPIAFDYNMEPYTGIITPLGDGKDLGHISKFRVDLNHALKGQIQHVNNEWISSDIKDKKLVDAIGNFIEKWIS